MAKYRKNVNRRTRRTNVRRRRRVKRRPTASITRVSAPKVSGFVRCIEQPMDMHAGMDIHGFMTISPVFKFSTIPEYANYQTLFRQFRITGVRTEFLIGSNHAAGSSALPQIELRIMSARGAVDVSGIPGSIQEALNIRSNHSFNLRTDAGGRRPFKSWAPTYVRNVAGDPNATSTGNLIRAPYFGTSNGKDVDHRTSTFIFSMSNRANPVEGAVTLIMRHYVYFKCKGQTF